MDDLIRRVAAQSKLTHGRAADQLDGFIYRIMRKLRNGEEAVIPGLGKFTPGESPGFEHEDKDG